jgi:hypothetical protein
MLLSSVAYAQKKPAFKAEAIVHSDSSLKLMDKGALVTCYMNQVNQIIDKVPYSVWGLDLQNKSLDIPKSKYMSRKKEGVAKDSRSYVQTNTELMYEVVYYADKQNLINAILYLQKFNSDITNVK